MYAEGLSVRKEKDNSVVFSDETGTAVFTLCPPYLYDAADREGAVSISAGEENGSFLIRYAPDPAFMGSASYPVTLDPVIRSGETDSSLDDTYVSSVNPTSNYNSANRMYVHNSGTNGTCHSLVMFTGLPSIGPNHYITNGTLVINCEQKPSSTIAVYAREITSEWTPGSVTWNSKPSYTEHSA